MQTLIIALIGLACLSCSAYLLFGLITEPPYAGPEEPGPPPPPWPLLLAQLLIMAALFLTLITLASLA